MFTVLSGGNRPALLNTSTGNQCSHAPVLAPLRMDVQIAIDIPRFNMFHNTTL
jgi:hypothetical protein